MSLPHGMSRNMMYIVQVEAERRKAGSKGYGDHVHNNDLSHLKVKKEEVKKENLCKRCGEPFPRPAGSKRRYCDECRSDIITEARRDQLARRKPCKCMICGKQLHRVNTESPICAKCRNDKKRKKRE